MSDVLGRGVIELVADARQLQAGIADAKKSIRTLGEGQKDISKGASDSIDRYISRLQVQQKTLGMSTRETELYKLAARGASNEQIKLADTTIRMTEAYERGAAIGDRIKSGLLTIGAAAATGLIAAFVAFDQLVKKAGDFQDMAEKTGDTAANFASLAVAAKVGGVEMDTLVSAANRLTKNLTGVDDESKTAGAAIKALGLNLDDFKKQAPSQQFETIAKSLDGFADGSGKSAIAVALLGKSGAEMLPFFKELAGETGRQNILTSEQIALADEYADKQARTQAQISMHAQAIATELLPAYNDLIGAFLDTVKGISGVSDVTRWLASDRGIQDFADSAVYSIAFIIDSVDGLIRVFQIAGKAIAGAAAIAVNPIQNSKAIFQAMSSDIEQTMNRPWMRDAVEKRQSDRKSSDSAKAQAGAPAEIARPTLKFDGATPKKPGGNSANQEAKAQLAADLDAIKKAGEAQINTFSNAEKIMEARRAAGLLDEREYYAAKLSFLNLNTSEQERTLQAEISRLESEKATGKERIDNQRKIADAQAQISKIRENASANTEILSIQEVAANEKIAKSYIDATIAAEAYIKTIADRNAREIAAVGKGSKNRGEMEGRNQIEDKFTGQRQVLERDLRNNQITQKQFDYYLAVAQDTYAKEVALYDDRTAALNAMEGDWVNGASEAFNNYMDEVNNVAKRTEDAFSDAFKSTERAMSDFLFDPFEDGVNGMLKSLGTALKRIVADFVAADLNKLLVSSIGNIGGSSSGAGGLAGLIAGLFGGGASGATDIAAMAGVTVGRASGGPVSAGNMYRVNERRPELLNIAGEQYLMMGSQSGSVDPNVGGGPSMSNVINIHMPAGSPAENRRAAGQGAREAMAAISSAGRYR